MTSLARILLALGRGALLWALLATPALAPPGPGEPLPLRWLRKLAEHPVRGSLALALVLAALTGPRNRPREVPEPAREPPDGLPLPPGGPRNGERRSPGPVPAHNSGEPRGGS